MRKLPRKSHEKTARKSDEKTPKKSHEEKFQGKIQKENFLKNFKRKLKYQI